MSDLDLFGGAAAVNLLGTQAVTETGQGAGVAVHAGSLEGRAIAILDAAAAGAGTTPTLDVKLVESAGGVVWTDVPGAAFGQVTDAAAAMQAIPVDLGARKALLAVAYTVGGTDSPSFAFSVNLVGLRKYR